MPYILTVVQNELLFTRYYSAKCITENGVNSNRNESGETADFEISIIRLTEITDDRNRREYH